MLSRIPSVMLSPEGKLEVFGSGEPIIYVNNRRISDNSEINRINIKEIKDVELITNPGAKYDATGNAIIKITTINNEEGWSAALSTFLSQSEEFTHSENARIGYTSNNFSISGYFEYTNYSNKSFNPSVKTIATNNDIYKYESDRKSRIDEKEYSYQFSLDYKINKDQIIGIQYDGHKTPSDYFSKDFLTTFSNNVLLEKIDIISVQNSNSLANHINTFHNGKFSKYFSSEFYFDYLSNTNDIKQDVSEIGSKISDSHTASNSNYDLYAAKGMLKYKWENAHDASLGLEYSNIAGKTKLLSSSVNVDKSINDTKEIKCASFAEYSYNTNTYYTKVGLRFEKVSSKFRDIIESENNLNKSYNNFFPSFIVGYNYSSMKNSLSFSTRIKRPSFRQLGNATYYANEFMYQKGNPLLVPEKSYIAQYMFSYDFFHFNTSYTYTKDYIFTSLETIPESVSSILSTFKNFNKIQYIKANLNIQKKIKWYNPSFSVGISKPYFKVEYLGQQIKYNDINYYFVLNQYIDLPKDYLLSIDYMYNNGGTRGSVKFKPYQRLNASLKKTFLKKKIRNQPKS